MNGVDLVLLACIVPFALRGLWRGFAREAVALGALAAGTLLAIGRARSLGQSLETNLGLEPEAGLLLAASGLFLSVVVAGAILGRLARRGMRAIFLGSFDRVAGGLLGLAQGAALVGFACLGVMRLAPDSPVAVDVGRSLVAGPLIAVAERLIQAARPLAPGTRGRTV